MRSLAEVGPATPRPAGGSSGSEPTRDRGQAQGFFDHADAQVARIRAAARAPCPPSAARRCSSVPTPTACSRAVASAVWEPCPLPTLGFRPIQPARSREYLVSERRGVWRSRPMSEDRHPAGSGQELPWSQPGEATHPSAGARSPGRRGFLLGVGGLAAAALMGPGGGWSRSEQVISAGPPPPNPGGSGSALDLEARRAQALQLRLTTAHQQLRDPFPQPQPNGDEDRYDVVGLASFTKALPHNDLGEVDPGAYRALLGPCGAAAQPTSGGSRWAAGSSWPTPRAPSPSSSRALTPGSGPCRHHRPLPARRSPPR